MIADDGESSKVASAEGGGSDDGLWFPVRARGEPKVRHARSLTAFEACLPGWRARGAHLLPRTGRPPHDAGDAPSDLPGMENHSLATLLDAASAKVNRSQEKIGRQAESI